MTFYIFLRKVGTTNISHVEQQVLWMRCCHHHLHRPSHHLNFTFFHQTTSHKGCFDGKEYIFFCFIFAKSSRETFPSTSSSFFFSSPSKDMFLVLCFHFCFFFCVNLCQNKINLSNDAMLKFRRSE